MSTELVQLRTYYCAPGVLLLARQDGEPAGCVGVHALTPSTGELRRLFVRHEYRGRGLGRRLLSGATQQARANGISNLVLTTLTTMAEARVLYDADGYVPVEPYGPDPFEGVQYLGRGL